jgi:hypothetical protein
MALTNQQVVDIRRYCGFSVSGNAASQSFREPVYTDRTFAGGLSLDYRLANLQPEEESVLTTFYLVNLPLRETEIQGAADNLDTDKAAVWTHNKDEVSDRRDLFDQLRRDLCDFLGIPPGPNLAQVNRLVRA